MVEARKNPYPENIWLDGATVLLDPQSVKGAQHYRRSDIAERQIAELRAGSEVLQRMSDAHREHAQSAVENCASLNRLLSIAEARAEAAEAENARLRALPLKDEVERVAEEIARKKGGYEVGTFGYRWLVEAISEALLSRLRAGEQEGWRSMDSAPKDWIDVLLYLPDTGMKYDIGHYDAIKRGWVSARTIGLAAPTLWQPLPAAPSEQRGDRG